MKKNLNLSHKIKICCGILLIVVFFSCKKNAEKVSDNSDHQTEKIGNAIFHTFYINGNKTIIKEVNGVYYFSEDEILSERQFNLLKLYNNKSLSTTERSTVTNQFVRQWTNGIVYYKISTASKQSVIQQAMNHISDRSAITFVVAQPNQSNYIEFIDGAINASNSVGMNGGRQEIQLYNNTMGIAAHEILHAIGMFHEQSRYDRDSYINIHTENMNNDSQTLYQFNIAPNSVALGNFDFNSIMLYDSYAFSNNGSATITKKDNSTFYGQRDHLSSGDIYGITWFYGSIIQGGVNLCSSSTYSLLRIPSTATISWTATPSGVVNIANAYTNSPTISKTTNGPVEIKATVSVDGETYSFTKKISSGIPTIVGTFTTTGYTGQLNPIRSSLWTLGAGGYYNGNVNIDSNPGDIVSFDLISKTSPSTFVNIQPNGSITISPSGHSAVIRITRSNSCGSTYTDCTFIANGAINKP